MTIIATTTLPLKVRQTASTKRANKRAAAKSYTNEHNHFLCSEQAYLQQAQQVKAANVGLYGIGAQCHFGNEEQPDEGGIKVSPRHVVWLVGLTRSSLTKVASR